MAQNGMGYSRSSENRWDETWECYLAVGRGPSGVERADDGISDRLFDERLDTNGAHGGGMKQASLSGRGNNME